MAISAAYVQNNQFSVAGDHEADLREGQKCLLQQGAQGIAIVTVSSSSYASGPDRTTVTVEETTVSPELTHVELGDTYYEWATGETNLAKHKHPYLPCNGFTQPEVDFLRDLAASGVVVAITGVGGETLSQYDVVYSDTADSGKWKKAVNDGTETQADAWGIVTEDGGIAAGATGEILLIGKVDDDSWSLTPGAILYLSDIPGGFTETKPASGEVRTVGHAISSTQIWFFPAGQGGGGSSADFGTIDLDCLGGGSGA